MFCTTGLLFFKSKSIVALQRDCIFDVRLHETIGGGYGQEPREQSLSMKHLFLHDDESTLMEDKHIISLSFMDSTCNVHSSYKDMKECRCIQMN